MSPRVTLGVATYERDTYLAEAVASCLRQTYDDLEVLVVLDGGAQPEHRARSSPASTTRACASSATRPTAGSPRPTTRSSARARGELIAMLGDDDVCEPDRIARQVAVFDRHPDTGVAHGAASIIDGAGRRSAARGPARTARRHELLRHLVREHNTLVDPSRMVHRRVYEAVGGYEPRLPPRPGLRLLAARRARLPLPRRARRPAHRPAPPRRELLRRVRPGARGRRRCSARCARSSTPRRCASWCPSSTGASCTPTPPSAARSRCWPTPSSAASCRSPASPASCAQRAARVPAAPRPRAQRAQDRPHLVRLQRLAAAAPPSRAWPPRSSRAAAGTSPSSTPPRGPTRRASPTPCASGTRTACTWSASTTASTACGTSATRCASSTTRRSRRPSRALLDRVRPDVVHFHNLHNLGAALIDEAAAARPAELLLDPQLLADLPARLPAHRRRRDLRRPGRPRPRLRLVRRRSARHAPGHQQRLEGIRDRFTRGVSVCLAVSDAMRATLAGQDYPADMIDVVQQAVPAADEVWERLGRDRRPGRTGERLTVAFFGSAYPHKGPQLLVEAAQRTEPGAARPHPRRGRRALRRASCAPPTRAAWSSCAAPSAPPSCPSCSPASTSPSCPPCGGTARR